MKQLPELQRVPGTAGSSRAGLAENVATLRSSDELDKLFSDPAPVLAHIREAFRRSDFTSGIDSTRGASFVEAVTDASRQLRFVASAGERGRDVRGMVLLSLAELAKESAANLSVGQFSRELTEVLSKALDYACTQSPEKFAAVRDSFEQQVSARALEAQANGPSAGGSASGPSTPSGTGAGVGPSNNSGGSGLGAGVGGGGKGPGGPVSGNGLGPDDRDPNPARVGVVGATSSAVPNGATLGTSGLTSVQVVRDRIFAEVKKVAAATTALGAGVGIGVVVWESLKGVGAYLNLQGASHPFVAKAVPIIGPGVAALLGGKAAAKVMQYFALRFTRQYNNKIEGPLHAALAGVKTPEGFFEAIEKSARFVFDRTGMGHISKRALSILELATNLNASIAISATINRTVDPTERQKLLNERYKTYQELSTAAKDSEHRLFTSMGSPAEGSSPQSLRERHGAVMSLLSRKIKASVGPEREDQVDALLASLARAEIGGFSVFTPGRTVEWFHLALGRGLGEWRKGHKDPRGVPSNVIADAKLLESLLVGERHPHGLGRRMLGRPPKLSGGVFSQAISESEAQSLGLSGRGHKVSSVWQHLQKLEEVIGHHHDIMCKGLGLRSRVMVETLLADLSWQDAGKLQLHPEQGKARTLDVTSGGAQHLVQLEKVSEATDPAQALDENRELARKANAIKSILLHTEIKNPAVPGGAFSSVGSAKVWLDFVRANPTVSLMVPQVDPRTGRPILTGKGDVVTTSMTGGEIAAQFDEYYRTVLTDEGRQNWTRFLDRIDSTYRRALKEQDGAEDVINPLIERVKDGRERPQYGGNVMQKLYDVVVRTVSGNSISWTLEPGMGKLEINDGRILLASYLEGMKKTLRHYDVFKLENEMTRETVIGNLARETGELLKHMVRRRQEYEGTVIERPSAAEALFRRYNPLFKLAESALHHTFTPTTGGIFAVVNYGYILGLGVGYGLLGPAYLVGGVGVVGTNYFVSATLPALKKWFGTAPKPQTS